jgi:hypothetical protein
MFSTMYQEIYHIHRMAACAVRAGLFFMGFFGAEGLF